MSDIEPDLSVDDDSETTEEAEAPEPGTAEKIEADAERQREEEAEAEATADEPTDERDADERADAGLDAPPIVEIDTEPADESDDDADTGVPDFSDLEPLPVESGPHASFGQAPYAGPRVAPTRAYLGLGPDDDWDEERYGPEQIPVVDADESDDDADTEED